MINKEWFLLLLGIFLIVTTYLVTVIKDYRNFRHLMFKDWTVRRYRDYDGTKVIKFKAPDENEERCFGEAVKRQKLLDNIQKYNLPVKVEEEKILSIQPECWK